MDDLKAWLDGVGLGDCHAALAAQDIDLAMLPDLSELDLAAVGLTLGQRRKLLRAIAAGAETAAGDRAPAVPARAERRQMTVMFCDLVGSTQLSMQLDPEDLQAVLRRSLDAIATTVTGFGGYVARFMGDGILVYFGWPRAHEDAAEQAARAGLAVVDAMAAMPASERLQVRVGMATGLVVVGEVLGGGAAREHVVTGATANLAARLQGAAAPDSVVIADATRRLLGNLFDVDAVGPFALKGIEGPVPAWRVQREREGDSRFKALRGPAGGIIGRSEERAALAHCWAMAAGGTGQVVLVSGEAGIGKTHVVEAFADGLAPPLARLRYQCLPHHGSTSLHPVIAAVRRASGFADGDSEAARAAKLAAMLAASGLPGAEPLGLFTGLLSLPGAALPLGADPAARKRKLLGTLVDFLALLAARQPLLLQVEDAHWADPTTLELCALIVARLAALPMLVIVTARPEFVPPWPAAAHCHEIRLVRMGTQDSAEMVRRVLGETVVDPGVTAQILAKTDGMPLFIEELTRELRESGALAHDGTGWQLAAGAASISVPVTLQDSLMARLDRLGWVKPVAQTAAVIGRNFAPPPLLAGLLDLPRARLVEALATLVDAGLVSVHGSRGTTGYGFRHALIQDAAYSGLLLSERRRLHAAVATLLETRFDEITETEPELVAHHWSEARQPDRAVRWWRKAGRRSLAASAHREAVDQFERALAQLALLPETLDRDRLETRLRNDLMTPLHATVGYTDKASRTNIDRIVELFQRTRDTALFPALGGQLSLAYGGSYMIRAVEVGEQLYAAAETSGERRHRMLARWTLGMALTGRGRLTEALAILDDAVAMSDPVADAALANAQSSNPRVTALAYKALVLQQLGHGEAAVAADRQAVDEAVASDHSVTIGLALTLRVSLHLLRCDHAALATSAAALAALARRQESRPLQAVAGAIAGLLRAQTATDPALVGSILAEVRGTIRALRGAGWQLICGWLGLFEAKVCLGHGRTAAARASLDELQAIIEPRGHDFFIPELYRLRAALGIAEGAPMPAIEGDLRHAIAVAGDQAARFVQLRAANDLARLWRDRGDAAAALALLAPLLAWFDAGVAGTRGDPRGDDSCADLANARAIVDSLRLPA